MTRERISPRRLPDLLVNKYEKSGPRYTSYPTAPHFHADFPVNSVLERWQSSNTPAAPGLSLYLHLPFCRQRCTYCGCYTLIGQDDGVRKSYLEALLRQADWALDVLSPERPLQQLSLGGGTPTSLTLDEMQFLVTGLRDRLSVDELGERAIEVDPRWVDANYLDLLVDLGFNRVSFGVQDLDPQVQENINRILPVEKLEAHMGHLHKRGLTAINLDLIYGLPGQTPEGFSRTVETIIRLRPSRIATFGYAHVPWVSPHQKELEQHGLPDATERMELFGLAYEMLLDAGWRHVGMDHFALPEDELVVALDERSLTRNFMGYTTRRGLDLVNLGASAIGSVAGTYVQNHKAISDCMSAQGTDLWAKGYLLGAEDLLRRDVILELFCNFHLEIPAIEEHHGIVFAEHFQSELNALKEFVDDGLAVVTDASLTVTPLGRFFIRNIAMTFDTFLQSSSSNQHRYSRTI